MANFTPNVNLEKPLGSEHYLIPKFNANMDKIDTKFGELQNLGGIISGATAKTTPVDADTLALSDSAAIGALKKLSWLNIKASLKTYLDTLYPPKANPVFTGTQTLPNIVTNGIKFPAVQVPSADPNTLDDYEEGTFPPTIIGSTIAGVGTYVAQVGRYIKIGKTVQIEILLNWNAHTGTGSMDIAGLPFSSISNAVLNAYSASLALSANNILFALTNGTSIILRQNTIGGGVPAVVQMDTSALIYISGVYQTSN